MEVGDELVSSREDFGTIVRKNAERFLEGGVASLVKAYLSETSCSLCQYDTVERLVAIVQGRWDVFTFLPSESAGVHWSTLARCDSLKE